MPLLQKKKMHLCVFFPVTKVLFVVFIYISCPKLSVSCSVYSKSGSCMMRISSFSKGREPRVQQFV